VHPRSAHDFLDALVALGMLGRQADLYMNTPETAFYLDRSKPTYIGSFFEMFNMRDYPFWGSLSEALTTGKPQNEVKGGEGDLFAALSLNPERLRLFVRSMTGHSLPSAMAIARKFPWEKYRTYVDIGTAEGCLPAQVALANPQPRRYPQNRRNKPRGRTYLRGQSWRCRLCADVASGGSHA